MPNDVIEAVKSGTATATQRRSVATQTVSVSVDKQGRLTLDEKAREFAGLTGGDQAVIVGNLNSIEVWRPSRYETIEAEDLHATNPRVWQD